MAEVASADNGFTILMGDTADAARTHFRDHIRGYRADSNSQIALDEWHKRAVVELAEILRPIKTRIIGAILGNHYWEYADGTNSEQYLCQVLGIPYLGPVGIVRLEFRDDGGRSRHSMVIYAHHHGGGGGGRTTGADLAAMERAEGNFDADIYVFSHTHRRNASKLPILTLTQKGEARIVERTKVFVRTGAFLKGFDHDMPSADRPHFPTYAESKALRPTSLGWVRIGIKLTQGVTPGSRGRKKHGDIKQEITLTY